MFNKQELLKQLEITYEEMNSITGDNLLLLNQELSKLNPIAIEIQKWFNSVTKTYLDSKSDIENDVITNFSFDSVGSCPYNYLDLKINISEDDISNYKIAPYIDIPFSDSRIHLIDFKRHLLPNVYLTKVTSRSVDGRPSLNEYFYNDELMATITFVFESDDNNIITRRKEILHYIKNDDSTSQDILIKDKIFDQTNPSDMALMVSERVDSRKYIIGYIEIFAVGLLKNYNPTKTHNEVVMMLMPYWDDCEYERLKFLDVGLTLWRDDLLALDISALPADREFLGYAIDGNGTTFRDYIVSLLTY